MSGSVGRGWAWLRIGIAVGILAMVAWRLGGGPFVAGLRVLSTPAVAGPAALTTLLVTALATAAAASRWVRLCAALGLTLGWRQAVLAYYRSQFLNATLPAGVLGDVHRAVDHGRTTGDLGSSARAVVWDRAFGQGTQLAAAMVLVATSTSWSRLTGLAAAVTAGLVLVAVGAWCVRQVRHRVRADLAAFTRTGAWPAILGWSVVTGAAHVAVFVVAARASGVAASLAVLVPVALVVLLAAAVPANIAGWGPREGAAAWVGATAGIGADAGVTVATVYGVLALLATLPGGVVLLVRPRPRRSGLEVITPCGPTS